MNDALIVSLLSAIPKNQTTRLMGAFSRTALPGALQKALLRWYVGHYKVDLDECQGTLEDYPTLARFFIRELKPGVRPVDPAPGVLVSPVDGRAHTFGVVEQGGFQQADGRVGSVSELLAEAPGAAGGPFDASRFEGGSYAILYLSPKDYHRVHSPQEGTVKAVRYRPGQLWPVFPAATARVEHLFDRNERLIFLLETPLGPLVVALIGAFGVGRMATPLAELITNQGGPAEDLAMDVPIGRAQEIGRFEMGSTVILLAEPGRLSWELTRGEVVRLGRPIGRAQAG